MTEMGDMWRAEKERGQKNRERNRKYGLEKLQSLGLPIQVKNNGVHIIVMDKFDYWPGTGLWKERGYGDYERGIKKLLKRIDQVNGGLK